MTDRQEGTERDRPRGEMFIFCFIAAYLGVMVDAFNGTLPFYHEGALQTATYFGVSILYTPGILVVSALTIAYLYSRLDILALDAEDEPRAATDDWERENL